MRNYKKVILTMMIVASTTTVVYPQTFPNMTPEEYKEAHQALKKEERGLVIENNPSLGYLVYINPEGREVTRNYYKNQVKVEKMPYYEMEDLIGYIDEMFPNFNFDPRDTTAEHIQPGDYIYMYLDLEDTITNVSASTSHIVRYGKIKQLSFGGTGISKMVIEDEQGQVFNMEVSGQVSVTKSGIPISIPQIQEGDWVKVLLSQGNIAPGNTIEYVKEIVVDGGSRYISNIYRGQITYINPYQNNINLQNAQAMQKSGWSSYEDIKTLLVDNKNIKSYYLGNMVSWDYVSRYLKNQPGYVYIAMENYYGKERAVKLDFQSLYQRTLLPDTIISAQPTQIKLMSGETVNISSDTIIRRNGRLVDGSSIMPSDYAQVVVTGESKAAVIDIREKVTMGNLQIFRGRIKKIKDSETFEVETFSILEDTLWMYHPIPRTFTIDNNTKFYSEDGLVDDGVKDFIGYGEDNQIDEVYTAIVVGDYAQAIIKMPYTRYAVRGEVYETSGDEIKIKDTYIYHTGLKRWEVKGRKDNTHSISLGDNAVVMKNGKIISPKSLAKGDKIRIMTDNDKAKTEDQVDGYLIIVEE